MLQDYFNAGYDLRFSESPPYPSSPVSMAFNAGVYCRRHGIPAGEIKAGRGYKMIINRKYILDFKESDINPKASQK